MARANSLCTIRSALQNSTVDVGDDESRLTFGTATAVTLGGLSGDTWGSFGDPYRDITLQNDLGQAVALSVGQNGANTVFYGSMAGSGSLTKIGTGTLSLYWSQYQDANPPAYTGGTFLQAGAINISDGSDLPSGTITFTGTATMRSSYYATLSSSQPIVINTGVTGQLGGWLTIGGTISGSGNLAKVDNSTVILGGVNTFTGLTTVNAGTLTVSDPLALQYSVFNADSTGTLGFAAGITAATFGGLQGTAGTVFSLPTAVALGVGNNGVNAAFPGTLTGGSLTKVGTGTLVLSNSGNSLQRHNHSGRRAEHQLRRQPRRIDGNLSFNGGILQVTGTAMTNLDSCRQFWISVRLEYLVQRRL